MKEEFKMRFVADTMLEKLARWLRILGYDVVFDSSKSLKELIEISNGEERVFLTRRKKFPEGVAAETLYDLCSENFNEQITRVIKQFDLDVKSKLFTRCIDCNVEVVKVIDKETIKGKVPRMSWEGFNDFYECPNCKKVFWKGAHIKNTVNKLNEIMDSM
ncbi:MAG: Mut7-C RNAse domain-containing protein [Bacteroidetes bacterium]|nr:Mut7-C RNAse domain-containing protein [Bacteroidota bacterium]